MQVPACVHAHQKRIPDTPRTGGCEQPNMKSSTRSRGALKRSKVTMSSASLCFKYYAMFLGSSSLLIHSSSVFLPAVMKGKLSLSHRQQHHHSINPHLWYPESCSTGLCFVHSSTIHFGSFLHPNVYTFYIFTSFLTFYTSWPQNDRAALYIQNEKIFHK